MSIIRKIKAAVGNVAETSAPPSTDVKERIAISAFYKAEARGFADGSELDDWLAAEAEINAAEKKGR
jgi:hypothetical protein